MIEITQTETVTPYGNCYAACIASIFELPLESLPAQKKMTDQEVIAGADRLYDPSDEALARSLRAQDWHAMWSRWFKENNLASIKIEYNFYGVGDLYHRNRFHTFHILNGLSPRTKYETYHSEMRYHSVVGKNGAVVWDPHPSREGLAAVNEIELIVPLDLAKPILQGAK